MSAVSIRIDAWIRPARSGLNGRISPAPKRKAAEFEDLSVAGGAPVCDVVEVKARHEPCNIDGDRSHQKYRVKKRAVFTDMADRVVGNCFHQSVLIHVAGRLVTIAHGAVVNSRARPSWVLSTLAS